MQNADDIENVPKTVSDKTITSGINTRADDHFERLLLSAFDRERL